MSAAFDEVIGRLHSLPDTISVQPTVLRNVPTLGVGKTQLYVVQTFRQREEGDTIFLECVNDAGTIRLVIPPTVANTIARQRDQLTAKSRSKASSASAQARKDRGEKPAFMRGKK